MNKMNKILKRILQVMVTPPCLLMVIPFTFLFMIATIIAVIVICIGAAFKRNAFPEDEDFETFGLIMLLPGIVFLDVVWETDILID